LRHLTTRTKKFMMPPHVAILAAGPVGLDAALACGDAGWPLTVY
jgi:NADPH-dependent 2,4-dienoyl-CoA reductase/sulfur reductase-like enzyme